MSDTIQSNTSKISETHNKTALITGANSGIGFETAAQLVEEGFGKIILACRTTEKGENARKQLIERTGKDVFDILAIDVAEFEIVHTAAEQLNSQKNKIDVLILNAGMSPGNTNTYNSSGVEITFASNIVGHHIFTMLLLSNNLLSSDARIVIAGSEGSRGDMLGMKPPDFASLADEKFDNDLEAALEAVVRHQKPYEDTVMNLYVTAKVFTNWWAAVLAKKLPKGMIVNAVSPGSVPGTNFVRHQGFMMRRLMMPSMKLFGRFFGMAWSVEKGANRYIKASKFDSTNTGHFYASRPGKLTGEMEVQSNPHFLNNDYQEAGWNVIVKVADGIDYPSNSN